MEPAVSILAPAETVNERAESIYEMAVPEMGQAVPKVRQAGRVCATDGSGRARGGWNHGVMERWWEQHESERRPEWMECRGRDRRGSVISEAADMSGLMSAAAGLADEGDAALGREAGEFGLRSRSNADILSEPAGWTPEPGRAACGPPCP